MKKEKSRVVLIGFGHIGKRHAKIILASEIFSLEAVVDSHLLEMATHLPESIATYSRLDDFLKDGPSVQIAVIATPNGLHAAQIQRCLDHGLDIVIEKPMALDSQDIKSLLRQASDKGLHLFPVIQNRYAQTARWLKNLLNSGALGNIYIIQVNCFWNRDERYYQPESWHGDKVMDGGTLYTQFLHFIDMLYWLFGDIKILDRVFFDFNHQSLSHFEDTGLIRFSFDQGAAKGALGTLQFTTSAWQQNAESALTLIAEKGSIKVGGQYMEQLEYARTAFLSDADKQLLSEPDPLVSQHGPATGHFLFWQELGKYYRQQPHELPEAAEAAKVIEIIEEIYKPQKS